MTASRRTPARAPAGSGRSAPGRVQPARRGRQVPPAPDARTALVAVALLLSAAVVVLPGGLLRFSLPKLAVVAAAVALAALCPAAGRLPRWAVLSATAGGGLLLCAALLSDAPVAQLVGRWPRYEGLVALPVYGGAVWAGARLLGPGAPASRRRSAVAVVAAVAAAVALLAILERAGLRPLSSTVSRPGSLLGNATDQGIVGAAALALLLPAAVALRTRWAFVGIAAAVVAVATSGSRGALLAAGAALAVVAVAGARRSSQLLVASLGTAAALAVASVLVPSTRRRLAGEGLAGQTGEGRRLLWGDTAELAMDSPLLGVGPSGLLDALPAYHGAAWAAAVGSAEPPDSPHSWPLQAWVAGGAGLALLSVGVALAVLAVGWRAARRADGEVPAWWCVGVLASVAAGLVGWATHPTSAGTVALVAPLAGALVAEGPVGARRTADRSVAAAAGAWCLVLTLAAAAEWPMRSGYAAAAEGSAVRAEAAFDVAAVLRPWDPDVALLAATALVPLAQEGDAAAADAASRLATEALDRVPDGLEAQRALALAREAGGDLPGARAAWDRVLAGSPVDADAYLQRGVVAAQQGDLDAAADDLDAAARLSPNSPAPWDNLARVRELAGDVAGATEARRQAAARR